MRSPLLILLSTLWLQQSQAMDLPKQDIMAYDCGHCSSLPHDSVNASWAIDEKLSFTHKIPKEVSRRYRIMSTMKKIQQGVSFSTQGKQAVIRITPLTSKEVSIPDFQIKTSEGKTFNLKEASSLYSQGEALKESPLRDDLVALQLKPELGTGQFTLTTSSNVDEDTPVLIHVFDKYATANLSIQTDKARYQYGDQLTVQIRLSEEDRNYPIDIINATLVNPDGDVKSLVLERLNDNSYEAKTKFDSFKNNQGENWYIKVDTTTMVGQETIQRYAHLAVSYAIPSATLQSINTASDSFNFEAQLDVATGSRYALEAILFGTDEKGEIKPIQAVQSANWLAPGQNKMSFSFDPAIKHSYQAPYYVGYLHLVDYGQFKPVYEYNTPIALTKLGSK